MKTDRILLFFAAVLFVFVWVSTPLIDEDEGLMAEISREMLFSGDLLSPKMNGGIRFDKPPFFNWLQVLIFKIFGLNNFAARFPAVVFSGIWVYFTFKIAKTFNLKNENTVFFLFFSSFQIVILSLAGIQETINNSCFCAIIFFLYFDKNCSLFLKKVIVAVFLSISFLTKGPLVFGLILMIVFVDFLINFFRNQFKFIDANTKIFKVLFSFQTFIITFILTSPWYILMYQKYHVEFLNGFFLNHNLKRFLATKEHHGGSYFYYLIVVFIGNIAIFPIILKSIVKEFRTNSASILLIIVFVVFGFFTFSATKLHHYIVIAYPAILLIVFKNQSELNLKYSFNLFLIFKAILIVVLFVFYVHPTIVEDKYTIMILQDSKLEIIQYLGVLICLIVLNLFFKKYNQMSHLGFLNFIFSLSFFYFVGNSMQKPIIEISRENYPDLSIISHYHPSLSFYSNRIFRMGEEQNSKYVFGNIHELSNQKGKIIFSKNGLLILEK